MDPCLLLNKIIKTSQKAFFFCLNGSCCPFKSSQVRNLDSFISLDGTLLVDGRLKFSYYPFAKRHPAILHVNHHLLKFLVESEHLRLLHAGLQHMLESATFAKKCLAYLCHKLCHCQSIPNATSVCLSALPQRPFIWN